MPIVTPACSPPSLALLRQLERGADRSGWVDLWLAPLSDSLGTGILELLGLLQELERAELLRVSLLGSYAVVTEAGRERVRS